MIVINYVKQVSSFSYTSITFKLHTLINYQLNYDNQKNLEANNIYKVKLFNHRGLLIFCINTGDIVQIFYLQFID